jgi:spore maturation protein CgeB
MKVVLFCHAFTSCWNNGHAHFLRGIARELIALGHRISVYEPRRGWSRANALADGGEGSLDEAARLVPGARIHCYDWEAGDGAELEAALDGADVVLVHEWNEPALVAAIGRRRQKARFQAYFMDSHHRAVTSPHEIEAFQLDRYDGILAFGEILREIYARRGWGASAHTWHEAADTALFRPWGNGPPDCDLVWIGNWGDDERSRELSEFLIEPVRRLGLSARVHGVRYPGHARALLDDAGIAYAGWLPNHRAPAAFARASVTVHVPRRAYSSDLPGIPTIRVFEALACGIPLVCSPWNDEEGLFPRGAYLSAADGAQMETHLAAVLRDRDLRDELARKGLDAIRSAHTCRHRVEQLLRIVGAEPNAAGVSSHCNLEQVL